MKLRTAPIGAAAMILALACALLPAPGCGGPGEGERGAARVGRPTFVGGRVCAECHAAQFELWQESHHDLAMQPADSTTVLGDFDEATFSNFGVTSTFSRDDGGYRVTTDGPDGELGEYEIAYTFGVEPLQQYLVKFPDGRYQTLSLCWDARAESEGGQRWYHLYPDEPIPHDDVLHWTQGLQNWNYMCAECHSTGVRRGYRAKRDTYDTTWSEIDVSCEACHGPGSNHVSWGRLARGTGTGDDGTDLGLAVRLADRDAGGWEFNDDTGIAARTVPRRSHAEIETCARCHSRRSILTEDYRYGRPLADSHRVSLLEEELYHPDGQILGEVYVYGSFLQSKMHRAGVTCKDCHEPHGARLYFEGNGVCAKCHAPARFDTPSHHFHEQGKAGSLCVDCHMVSRVYMGVDPRRDHSFRVPRPDLSMKLGTPNACNDCHTTRSVEWTADAVTRWYGTERAESFHYAQALHAGRNWLPAARDLLTRVADDLEIPGIARASALSLLVRYAGPGSTGTVERALRDDDPLVRAAALPLLELFDPEMRWRLGFPLLSDDVRSVRLEAARTLATVPAEALTARRRASLDMALDEYRQAQRDNADRAESWLMLGWLDLRDGDHAAAEASYLRAIRMEPRLAAAYVNLSDLYRVQGRDAEGEKILRRSLELNPDDAGLHHALGLALVRRKRASEAMVHLGRATELAPQDPRFAYVYGVALHDTGEIERSRQVLETAHERTPAAREPLYALIAFAQQTGDLDGALSWARKLAVLAPDDAQVRGTLKQLESSLGP